LHYADTNLTFDIPSGWMGDHFSLDIDSVFQPYEVFNNYSLNGNFDTRTYPWGNTTSNPWYKNIPTGQSWVNFSYNAVNQYATLTAKSGSAGIPENGFYFNRVLGYNKGSNPVDLSGIFENQKQVSAINNPFTTNPQYQVLIDP